jgi:hypothetical protein
MPEILHPPPLPVPASEQGSGLRSISLGQLLGQMAGPPRALEKEGKNEVDLSGKPPAVVAAARELAEQLTTQRLELFGRYYEELELRMRELRDAMDAGLARSRLSMTERTDDVAAALQRDTMSLRQEQQREIEDLKHDVFTAVMSLSAVNDRINAVESRLADQVQRLQETVALLAHRTAPDLLAPRR